MTLISKSGLFVSLAGGIFIGGALLDVLPETAEHLGMPFALLWLFAGYLISWIVKLAWYERYLCVKQPLFMIA